MRNDVRAWFDRRTSTSAQWDRHLLAELKGETPVSVVLPARNEEATVGVIVDSLRRNLIQRVPLIDELVVVDSGSQDQTARCAAEAGARVIRQRDILPRLGDVPGKGEALWKSLAATRGAIVVFIDADLRSFDTQFVVSLLGPLLSDPDVQFVKAFYDRPLHNGAKVMPAGGGRVTELVARPMLNLHWPILAGFVQPLAGEYAARRSLLERLPFVSGYGVEIAMLIDVVQRAGLDAMAQVDLGRREHRNSTDAELGQMAVQVAMAVLLRLHSHGKALLTEEPSMSLTQFVRDDGVFVPFTTDLTVSERPPMIEVAEYQRPMAQEPA
ncbi:MAG: glucosyl-3-phosphoglycerate synthase [Nocardioidaceae bacterium]|nr:glucosyl-3-phosphoglycerate synthase [Nocardioidaceae bacterium]